MELLKPAQAAQKSRDQEDRDSRRILELQTLIAQKTKELAVAEEAFDIAMQRNRNQWAAEQQEHENKLAVIEKKTTDLEERRAQATVPLTTWEQRIKDEDSALQEREKGLEIREANVEESLILLQQRLDEVSEREFDADKVAKMVANREVGVKQQASEIKQQSQYLTKAIVEAQLSAATKEQELSTKAQRLDVREQSLEERERQVQQKLASYDAIEKGLNDKYESLIKAEAEFKQKHVTQ